MLYEILRGTYLNTGTNLPLPIQN